MKNEPPEIVYFNLFNAFKNKYSKSIFIVHADM